jgi:hypothetical protein
MEGTMLKINALILCAIILIGVHGMHAAATPTQKQIETAAKEGWNSVEGWANAARWAIPTPERAYRVHPTIEGRMSTALLDLRDNVTKLQKQVDELASIVKGPHYATTTTEARPELERSAEEWPAWGDVNVSFVGSVASEFEQ